MLNVKNLTVKYGNIVVLDDISFQVGKSEIVSIVGQNGSGKSTLLKAITGTIPYDGTVEWFNEDKKKDIDTLIKSSVSFQNDELAILNYVSVKEYLIYFALTKTKDFKEAIKLAEEFINILWLDKYQDFKLNQLSRGNKQRLSFASTLITDPSIIFLDEPTSGVDIEGVEQFNNLIKEMAKNEKTIIISSHNLKEVEDISTRILLLSNTKIYELDMSNYNSNKYLILVEEGYNINIFLDLEDIIVLEYRKEEVLIEIIKKISINDFIVILDKNGVKIKEFYRFKGSVEKEYLSTLSEII